MLCAKLFNAFQNFILKAVRQDRWDIWHVGDKTDIEKRQ